MGNPIDVVAHAGWGGTAASIGPITTTSTNEQLIAFSRLGSGGTAITGADGTVRLSSAAGNGVLEDRSIPTAGAYTASWTNSGSVSGGSGFVIAVKTPTSGFPVFIQTAASLTTTASFGSNVTAGNLLLAAFQDTAATALTTISDTQGNTWNPLATALGGVDVWWAIAKSSAACTVTFVDTGGNPGNTGSVVAEYNGATGLSGIGPYQTFGANVVAISAGPVTVAQGAFTLLFNYAQSTTYVSSSGGTPRTSPFANRLNLIDNLGVTGSYTETGTVSGTGAPDQFGGDYQTFGFVKSNGPPGAVPVSADGPMNNALFPVLMARMRIAAAYRNRK